MKPAIRIKATRMEIAVALDTAASRFCVMYNELTPFVEASEQWNKEEIRALDEVIHAGKTHPQHRAVLDKLLGDISAFTCDSVIASYAKMQKPDQDNFDVPATFLASARLYDMASLLEKALHEYTFIIESMRKQKYLNMDTIQNKHREAMAAVYHILGNEISHMHYAVRAVSLHAPALGSLYTHTRKSLCQMSKLKPLFIELKDLHQNSVLNSCERSVVAEAYA